MRRIKLNFGGKTGNGKSIPEIPSEGLFALIDDGDFELISSATWFAVLDGNTFYAVTAGLPNLHGRIPATRMHRLILNAKPGQRVDHIDENGLNNQKSNLRLVTGAQNTWNTSKVYSRSIIYKPGEKVRGVCYAMLNGRRQWIANIMANGRRYFLGAFGEDRESAIKARLEAERKYYGEFAPVRK